MKHFLHTALAIKLIALVIMAASIAPAYAYRQSDLEACQKVKGPRYYQACIRLIEMASLPPEVLATANFGLGSHYYWQKNYKKAIPYFNKTIALHPAHQWVYIRKGRSFAALGQYKKAIAIYSEGIDYNSHAPAKIYFNRGYAYSMMGLYDQSIADLTQYLLVAPNDSLAHHHRGYALLKKGSFKRAIADFSNSLRFNPNASQIYQHRADAFFSLGKYPKAISDYSTALSVKPKTPLYLYKRGMSFRRVGALSKSLKDCHFARSLNPYYLSAYYCLARGYANRFF